MLKNFPPRRQNGFTLLEATVVIVVIALVIGGVLSGRELIRQSELRSVLSDIEQHVTAMNAFRVKYGCIPGDCNNATEFFGTDPLGCPDGGGSTGTCNGNGNERICDPWDHQTFYEYFRLWQQLSLARLIPGTYTGVSGPDNEWHVLVGVNVPRASKLPSKAGYRSHYFGDYTADPDVFPGSYGHIILLGTDIEDDINYGPALTTGEALALDLKGDDGRPGSGSIVSFPDGSRFNPDCATTAVVATARYDKAKQGLQCALYFKLEYFGLTF